MFKKVTIIFLLTLACFIAFSGANAQEEPEATIHSKPTGGDWYNANTWEENRTPNGDDIVEISPASMVYLEVNTSAAGLIIKENAKFSNKYGLTRSLTVNGDLINNGTISDYDGDLNLTVLGNAINNGEWKNRQTRFSGNTPRMIGPNAIESLFINFANSFEILNSPTLKALSINLNDQTLILNSPEQTLTLSAYELDFTSSIEGKGTLVLDGTSEVNGTVKAPKLIIKSPSIISFADGVIINSSVVIEPGATMKHLYRHTSSVIIYGDIENNGSINDPNTGELYLYISGNIKNNGVWTNDKTFLLWDIVLGGTNYELNFSDHQNSWPTPIILNKRTYNITANINEIKYWRTRANINGLPTPWSEIKTINGEINQRNPVIIVPGILGSKLEDDNLIIDKLVWPSMELLDPADEILDRLEMDSFGFSKENIVPTDIIRNILWLDFYGGLIEYLEANGYEEGENLFVFPYDWRFDLNIIAGDDNGLLASNTLKEVIKTVRKNTGSEKVDIIAHSMGGLVTKVYVQKYGEEYIDKFIDIATPHLGAPKAVKILNYGDDMGIRVNIDAVHISFLNVKKVKQISQNMPSIYQLLPSQQYFTLPGEEYEYYIFNDAGSSSGLPTGELDYNQSLDYIIKTGDENRSYFVNMNTLLHSAIDNVEIDNSYNIVGCGMATIGKIKALGKKKFFWNKYEIEYIDGDGTVPLKSADYYGDRKYYMKEKQHSQIPSADEVKKFIGSILNGEENSFDFSAYNNFADNNSICGISGQAVEYHCPVEMHIYDNQGNHVGLNENGDIEINIPGVQYDIIDDNKFVFLPKGTDYTVTGKASSTGVLEIKISEIINSQYQKTIYFNEIDIESALTRIEFDLEDNLEEQLIKVDQDGDGYFEEELSPDSILDEEERKDLIKPTSTIAIIGTENNNGYYISDVEIEISAQDNENGSGILKTEYSLDNKETWTNYQEPFTISTLGTTTILYSSTDRAGNREENKQEIIVIMEETEITIDTTIQDIKTAYQDGDITKRWVKNSFVFRLNLLQRFINGCGNKKICKRIIKIRYKAILRSLNRYHRRGWVKNPGYDIIKENIEYLINNL